MRFLKITLKILLCALLTVVTQTGGLVYLLALLTFRWTDRLSEKRVLKITYRVASFLVLYSMATFLIVPMIAKPLGRVPLPLTENNHLQPLNVMTVLLNRHYVKPELRETAFAAAQQLNKRFPGSTINYLDANFPFGDGFPLLPHLSHNDGKKLDLSFCYRDAHTGEATDACPSFIGYGICEEPLPGEVNTAAACEAKGNWQYDILRQLVPQGAKNDFVFDGERTCALVNLFAAQPAIGKIFIEPHLQKRLNLTSEKIRFHGCSAVRHDDHVHVQLR
jgi:hypothetical protein